MKYIETKRTRSRKPHTPLPTRKPLSTGVPIG